MTTRTEFDASYSAELVYRMGCTALSIIRLYGEKMKI